MSQGALKYSCKNYTKPQRHNKIQLGQTIKTKAVRTVTWKIAVVLGITFNGAMGAEFAPALFFISDADWQYYSL